MKLRHVAQAMTAAPWAIAPQKIESILGVLNLRMAGGRLSAEAVQAAVGDGAGVPPTARMGGGVAVIPMQGIICPRTTAMDDSSSNLFSLARFNLWFDAAMKDDTITTIVLDIDSPGGQVGLVAETAAKIMAAREQKKIIAVANTLAASAAYWIAAAASEVVASPSAEVGSIGVLLVHCDESQANAEDGLTYTLVASGKYKTEGSPFAPLDEEAQAAMQQRCEEFYQMFVSAVAKGRGVSPAAVRSGFGEGRVVGATEAKGLGMVDRVASLDDVLAKLGSRRGGSRLSARADGAPLPVAAGPALAMGRSAAAAVQDVLEIMTEQITGDHAPPTVMVPLTAPKAKEQAMEPEITASQAAPAPSGAGSQQLQAELARVRGFKALRKEHPMMAAKLEGWEEGGVSLEQAQANLAASYREQLTTQPRGVVGDVSATGATPNEAKRPFASFGEQMLAIVAAGKPGGRRDIRLNHINDRAMAVASGMNESVGSEGGFFIQPELLPGVIDPVFENDPIVSRVNRIPISGNAIKYNVVDETSRANGSRYGGIQAYWAAEADTPTAKKPKLRLMELALKKIIGIGYLTDELQADAPAAEALLTRAFQSEVGFMIGDAIFRGLGGGMPLGFLNSSAYVSQAIEGSQTIANSNQYIALNLAKMLARVPASLWGDMIWLYNQELLPKLITAAISGTAGTVPVFMTQGGMTGKPFDTILGRPAFASELCEAEGTTGDLIALVPSQYDLIDKGGPQAATSVHVRFIYDENTLRITYRTDGAPRWVSAVTRYKGSATLSPYVGLAARS